MTKRDWAIDFMLNAWKRGDFYSWGAQTPGQYDCSGIVIQALKVPGILPRKFDATANRLAIGMGWDKITWDFVERGDLVFWKNSSGKIIHVEMVIDIALKLAIGASGGGPHVKTKEDAIKYNAFVKIRPIHSRSNVWGYVNPYIGGIVGGS